MKRWMSLLLSVMLVLALAACASAPEATVPTAPAYDYDVAYDMADYDYFSDIFEEKPAEEWDTMGAYTMLLNGLHTPVLVNMDGTDVLSISAHGHTVELGEVGLASDYHDGYSPVWYIDSTEDAVVIRVSGGESPDNGILITKGRSYNFLQDPACDAWFSVREDGTLEYCRIWNDPIAYEQEGYYALSRCTDRQEPLYETGRAEFADGELVLNAEETVVLSDLFDLEAMFAEAQADGVFTEYETLDALLAANLANAGE